MAEDQEQEKSLVEDLVSDLEQENEFTPTPDKQEEETPAVEKTDEKVETTTEQTTEEKPSDEPEQPLESVITAEFVEKHGLSKHLIGKPFDELANSYANMMKQDTKLSQELASLKQKVDTLELSATKKEEKAAEKETVDEFGNMPDMIEDPEGWKTWMKNYTVNLKATLQKETREELLKEIKPTIEKVNETSTKDLITDTVSKIQSSLPEDVKANDILVSYVKENQEYFDELIQSGKGRTPESLAREVIKDYKAKQFDKLSINNKEEIERKATEKAAEQLRKKTNNTKPSELNTHQRESQPNKGLVSELLADAIADQEQN